MLRLLDHGERVVELFQIEREGFSRKIALPTWAAAMASSRAGA